MTNVMLGRLRRSVISLLITFIIASAAVAQEPGVPGPVGEVEAKVPAIPWGTDLTKATGEAADKGKAVFVDFTAAWCGPCRVMKSDVFPNSKVIAAMENFIPVMIDEAKNQELLAKYKIEAFPTFVVLNSQGREAARATGALTAERFVEFVDYANAVLTVEKIPDDADALYRRGRWGVLYAPTLEQKREQVDAALRAVGETEKEKRARLLVAKAMLADSAKAGEVPEEAYKHLREARQLDADNGFGVREEADYFILALEASQQKDEAALRKAVADYFAKYPPNKLRDRNIAMQLLEVQFQLQVKAADYAAAISTLETTKALVDDPKVKQYVDGLIADVRKEQEKAAAKD